MLTLSTYLAGSGTDIAYAIGHDAHGFEYIAGTTSSADFPVTGNASQLSLAGSTDIFLAQIDPSAPFYAQVLYVTYLGGSLAETFGGMAVGPQGDVYLTGTTVSTDFPTVNPFQTSLMNPPGSDAFVVWIDSNQNLAYSTYLGGSSTDGGNAIAVDSTGRLWVTGGTQSDDFPNFGGFQTSRAGSQDIFITGIDLTQAGPNTAFYSSYLGGSGWENGRGIAAAPDGTLWVVGGTYSFDAPVVGASYQTHVNGGGDAYIAHINPNFGADGLLYSTYFGGSGVEEARNVILDSSGEVIVSGFTTSSNFPVTSNAMQPTFGGNTDAFVSILNLAGPPSSQVVYSTYFGGPNGDVPFDLKQDANGVLYLAGLTLSQGLPSNSNSLQPAYDGTMDAFILRFNPSRAGASAVDYFTYLGSDGVQVAYGVDFDSSGHVYMVGSTSGPIFDPFGGPPKPSEQGNTNAFVAGLSVCGFTLTFQSEQFGQQGGSDTVGITEQQADCRWTASSTLDWVTVSPASGNGDGQVTITVAPNNTGAPRQGSILIAGVNFVVGQD